MYLSIQYARALAATLVVVGHALSIMPGTTITDAENFGGIGVDIFFVVSGFVMWVTTENNQLSTPAFWLRRIKRIVPLYWVFTSVIVAVGLAAPWALNSTKVTIEATIKSYLFIPHYYSNDRMGSHVAPLLGPGWTLNYEMFFYAIFGVLLIVPLARIRLLLITLILSALVLIGSFITDKGPFGIVYTDQLLLEFLFGIYVGRWRGRIEAMPRSVGVGALVASALLMTALFYGTTLPRAIMFGVPALLFIIGAVTCERWLKTVPFGPGLLVGDASYSLYLTHLFAIAPFDILAKKLHLPWLFSSAVAVVTAYAVGILVYLLLEKPIASALGRSASKTREA